MNPIYPILSSILNTSDKLTIIECGAHDGSDSYSLRRTFPHASIFSFEPDPRNIAKIRERGIDRVVDLNAAAVGDRDGTAPFHLSSANMTKQCPEWIRSPEWSGSSSLKQPAQHLEIHPWCEFNQTLEVPILRLDTFGAVKGITNLDLIWADVQGAEDLLIAGAQKMLATTSYFYTEYSEVHEYQDQLGLAQIMTRLPGLWEVVRRFPYDVLFRNVSKLGKATETETRLMAA
ncbi:MAG: FkbM family methyltransferase [Planctomycetes bacterium]|nr:FkbM family methyltransferase [Planctomycetota bacterium]